MTLSTVLTVFLGLLGGFIIATLLLLALFTAIEMTYRRKHHRMNRDL